MHTADMTVTKRESAPDDDLPVIDDSLPASHEAHLDEFHAARKAGYTGSIYQWHKENFGTFW